MPEVGFTLSQTKNKALVINDLCVDYELRGKGLGSFLLKALCDWADTQNVVLELDVQPFDVEEPEFNHHGALLQWRQDNKQRLVNWYLRHAFVDCAGRLVRQPKL